MGGTDVHGTHGTHAVVPIRKGAIMFGSVPVSLTWLCPVKGPLVLEYRASLMVILLLVC